MLDFSPFLLFLNLFFPPPRYLEDRREALVASLQDITPYKPMALCDSIRSAASLVGSNIPPAPLDTHELARVHRVSVSEWDKPLPHVKRLSQQFVRTPSDPDTTPLPLPSASNTEALAARLFTTGAPPVPEPHISSHAGADLVEEDEEEEELERAPSPVLQPMLLPPLPGGKVPMEVGAIFEALRQQEQWPVGPPKPLVRSERW